MNILNIASEIEYNFDSNIAYDEVNTDYIKKIIITIKKDTILYINSTKDNAKINLEFNILDSVNLNLFELKVGSNSKIQYVFNLNSFTNLNIFKFTDGLVIKERNIFNLKEDSNLVMNFKTICTTTSEYDFLVNHKGVKSKSNLYLNGVNIKEGKLSFNLTSEVNKGIIDCTLNQESKIINLTDLECIIKPNLLIDEYNVVANHSAKIGSFNKEKLFYLQSRGIEKDVALKLLIKGFLLSNIGIFKDKQEIIEQIINKYWR